ncbi:ribosome assembly RNA-binding protein YhbY [Desulfuribacillus alkaliarsenatis]|uniref:RNA-binding protein n=1 Tax=Desulfuribacillus alkaliarsenatis TaxID=766136 RepID=A0A1E5G1D7_9FIRM|nr:ribosome assembly RNA-binding protein YhbY [Desulfuribacillus alkaliarsenatis]OEF96258.1 RNA-binding protein [Desulfuribacillus alkaliarsenatis]
MLTGKQKRHLRSLANPLEPIFQVGKGGANSNLYKSISEALEARELIKISVLKNCLEEKQQVAEYVAKHTDSEIVQIIGSTIILYKESAEKKKIELP